MLDSPAYTATHVLDATHPPAQKDGPSDHRVILMSSQDSAPHISAAALWAVMRRLALYEPDVAELVTSYVLPDIAGCVIGEEAFCEVFDLVDFEFPQYLTRIHRQAFVGTRLVGARLPKYLTGVDEGAFALSGLTIVTFDPETRGLVLEDGVFEGCLKLQEVRCGLPLKDLALRPRVFKDCKSLRSIELPPDLLGIPDGTFCGCEKLETLALPSGIIDIGKRAFDSCISLLDIEYPRALCSIGDRAFRKCSSLTNVVLPATVHKVGKLAFEGATSVVYLKIAGGPNVELGKAAFKNCTRLAVHELGRDVVYGKDTFEGCLYLRPQKRKTKRGKRATNW